MTEKGYGFVRVPGKPRRQEMFYLNDDGVIRYEMGYECPPNDGYWWFPSVGYSTSGVYGNKRACLLDALKWVDSEMKKLEKKKENLLKTRREGRGT